MLYTGHMAIRAVGPWGPKIVGAGAKPLRAMARDVWEAWNRGASVHSISVRRVTLAAFGAHTWRVRSIDGVLSRMIDAARSDPNGLRTKVREWAEHERAIGLSRRTTTDRWRTLAAACGQIASHLGEPRVELGPRPTSQSTAETAAEVASRLFTMPGRFRDVAILGLLAQHTMREIVALRVRDAASLTVPTWATAALAACTAGRRPQDPLLRGRTGRRLSRASISALLDDLGLTTAACRDSVGACPI